MKHITLSIDIGVKNLGWTLFASSNSFIETEDKAINIQDIGVTFGIYNITESVDRKDNVVVERSKAVMSFFKKIAKSFIIDYVIIERQVPTNEVAMELMYCITTAAQFYVTSSDNIIIFDPKLKFTMLGLAYDTKNKAHKRLSIEICRSIIINIVHDKLHEYDHYDKRDDIADSFNQGIEWLCVNKKITYSLHDIKALLH